MDQQPFTKLKKKFSYFVGSSCIYT